MKTFNTTLQKAIALCVLIAFSGISYAGAQGIIPPDEPGDLQDLPFKFNVDTDEIDWEDFTFLPFEGAGMERLENPDPDDVNDTDMVIMYVKGGAGEGGQPWAGFFYHTEDVMEINDDAVFRLKVWSPRADITAMLKLEMREFPDVETPEMFVDIETANEWIELEWDLSGVDRSTPWDRVVMIFDLQGEAGDAGDQFTWFIDDFEFDNGTDTSTGQETELPRSMTLEQNYPNPFNPTTQINFSIPQNGHATLEVFDMLGRSVSVLVNESLPAGRHTVNFDASSLSSGVYMYRLQSGNEVITRKLTLMK